MIVFGGRVHIVEYLCCNRSVGRWEGGERMFGCTVCVSNGVRCGCGAWSILWLLGACGELFATRRPSRRDYLGVRCVDRLDGVPIVAASFGGHAGGVMCVHCGENADGW